tara:strand:- start:31 stop:513 length:483 start_codon:yes stop_codon:yes gene_type:complete
MPNWTSNSVLFVGKEKQLKTLQTMLKSKDNEFDFNNIIPMPKELEGTVSGSESAKPDWQKEQSQKLKAKYGVDNWYDWTCSNWGTKWNAVDTEAEQRDGTLMYRFNTAWDCPRQIVVALLRMKKTILKDINISWECVHEDGAEEETILDIEVDYEIEETS